MKKSLMSIVIVSAVVLLAGCTQTTTTPPTGDTGTTDPVVSDTNTGGDSDLDALATCMTDAGVIMYGTEWCSHCKDQKALFGDSFANVNYVDCDAQRPACVAAGVQGFPTWKDTAGNAYPGTQSLERLAEIAGCSI